MATTVSTTTGSLPSTFEPYYQTGATGASGTTYKGLIPQAFDVYGKGSAADYEANVANKLKGIAGAAGVDASGKVLGTGLYGAGRIAGLTPDLTTVQTGLRGLTTPTAFTTGQSALAKGVTGLEGLTTQGYEKIPTQTGYSYFSMNKPTDVAGGTYTAPTMATASTTYDPALQQYIMDTPEQFGAEQVKSYMSPYMQEVVDVQKREAIRDAQKAQLAQNLGAARQGTYGGARQLLAATERERALGTQLGDIQARGLQAAYEQAGTQFEKDRAAKMLAEQQNLQAKLGVQQLGTQTGLQTALANLSSEQQANVQNLAAKLQTQGLSADQAIRAALANQQTALATGQQNLAANLAVQQLYKGQEMEAARANQAAALQAAQQKQQAALGLGTLGTQYGQIGIGQQAADLDRLKALGAFGDLTRGIEQQQLEAKYADAMQGILYPKTQLEALSGFLRGIPMTDTTQTTTTPPPSFASQLAGLGLSGLSLYNLLGGQK